MNNYIEPIKFPNHLAVIMDGNGRWAKKQGMLRVLGHENGAKSVEQTIEYCVENQIKYVTLYAFSTENWNRPKHEVKTLMELLVKFLKKKYDLLAEHNIRLNAIGDLQRLPQKVAEVLFGTIEKLKNNTGTVVTLALGYGAREELVRAVKNMVSDVNNRKITAESIDESLVNRYLYTFDLPDVDLLIRTSGECRISNFLLWQIAYAELYFTDVLWPDFTKEHLHQAVLDYQKRERRFGKTSEQLK
ncbi:undecaprenyl pyrophosphate synthase [Capnocytophaga canimorsus]|uniref:Isoprenyl transferase n=2 Tax=Capnocytophaga canimorsus TaxID=28188 RepID=F9YUG9_CAPCC|nr:Undecaprenyl diphosphate synthase [Capnocytophaga canimorsus Cc5]ATA76157.1 di-trans,poly-cis-decaprenylcistransferase [Capnocytophaga canimorsus]ATA92699.1 di-trans,poly-cis-decaprenylcistransferase [Capnocytophaga canimorsus]PJI80359.1 undecaprenyl diphosphate synthase [Capnocytophaga canimorsus]CEN33388.1 undecaprenyl pyrophosphate synthase [Capnocytophaga canimorsus]